MRCRSCEYPLWNIPGRSCPECGEPFRPSDYTFAANKVEFVCPDCGQQYYGTDEYTGHLNPRSFACVGCQRALDMDDCLVRPAPGTPESRTLRYTLPWLKRKETGRIVGWFKTLIRTSFDPMGAIDGVEESTPAMQTWRYAVFNWSIPIVVWASIGTVLMALFAAPMGGPAFGPVAEFLIGLLVVGVMVPCIIMPVWIALAHAVLRITGGCAGEMRRTAHAITLGSSPLIITIVPCFGGHLATFIGVPWWIVISTIMLARGQQVHGFRATIAVAGPALAVGGAIVGLYVLLIVSAFSAMQITTATINTDMASFSGKNITTAMTTMHSEQGVWPGHIAELMLDNSVMSHEYTTIGEFGRDGEVAMSGTTLAQFELLPRQDRRKIITRLERDVQGQAAYRFGDYVVCTQGVTADMAPETWILIYAPAPDLSALRFDAGELIVFNLDGTTQVLAAEAFDLEFDAQQSLRADQGLDELPDPRTLNHPTSKLEPEP